RHPRDYIEYIKIRLENLNNVESKTILNDHFITLAAIYRLDHLMSNFLDQLNPINGSSQREGPRFIVPLPISLLLDWIDSNLCQVYPKKPIWDVAEIRVGGVRHLTLLGNSRRSP